jgi:hypothetical protein
MTSRTGLAQAAWSRGAFQIASLLAGLAGPASAAA